MAIEKTASPQKVGRKKKYKNSVNILFRIESDDKDKLMEKHKGELNSMFNEWVKSLILRN